MSVNESKRKVDHATKAPHTSESPHCLDGVLITPLSEGTSSCGFSPAGGVVATSCGIYYDDEEDPLPKVKPKVQRTQYTTNRGGHCVNKQRDRNNYESALTLATPSNNSQTYQQNDITHSMNDIILSVPNQGSSTNCNGSRMYVFPNTPLSTKSTHCCNELNKSRNKCSHNEIEEEETTPFINAEHPIVNRITLAYFNGEAEVSERAEIMLTPHAVTYVSAPTTTGNVSGSLCTPTSSGTSAGRMSHRYYIL